jgi:hypothetical protein
LSVLQLTLLSLVQLAAHDQTPVGKIEAQPFAHHVVVVHHKDGDTFGVDISL